MIQSLHFQSASPAYVSQILQAKLRIILVINKLILQLKLLQCKVQVRLT